MFKSDIATKVFFVMVFSYSGYAQDFNPDPLEPQTDFSISTTPVTETTTYIPTTTTIEISTEGSTKPTTTEFMTTVDTTIATTSTVASSLVPSTISSVSSEKPEVNYPTTTPRPYYPNTPVQKCYFRKQRGVLQHFWTCEGPKWGYSIECYYCCQDENAMVAGCNKVDYSYCEYYYY